MMEQNNYISRIKDVLIVFTICICVFLGFYKDTNTKISYITKTDTSYIVKTDSFTKTNFKYVSLAPSVVPSLPIDTMGIINSYLSAKNYFDTFKIAGEELVVKDSITGDSLKNQSVIILDSQIVIRDSIFIKPKDKMNIYVGAAYDKALYPKLIFSYQKINFDVGYNGNFVVGISYKIK